MSAATLERRFIQCDVFTATPTRGNALAVVVDGDGLSEEAMRTFAVWTNLAETTFLLPPTDPTADYRVRIFTPTREMPFAGHPTLGSCAAWLHCGGIPKDSATVRQECGVGIVEIDLTSESPAFIAPPTRISELPEKAAAALAAAMQLDPGSIVRTALLDNGPQWQVFLLESAEQVLGVDSAGTRWPEEQAIGLIGPYPAGSEVDYEVRMLAPSSGMSEDPITGSLNAALAHWLYQSGELQDDIVVAQGRCIGREGRVFIRLDGSMPGRVRVGGSSHVLIDGSLWL